MSELKPLDEVLKMSLRDKLEYIRHDLARAINERQRGDPNLGRTREDVYKRLFNGYNDKPQGEISEIIFELRHRNGLASYLGELADLITNALRYDDRLLEPIYGIGKSLGLDKDQIANGCTIKLTSRAVRGRNYGHEKKMLEDYFGHQKEPSRRQRKRAIKKAHQLLKMASQFAP